MSLKFLRNNSLPTPTQELDISYAGLNVSYVGLTNSHVGVLYAEFCIPMQDLLTST